MHYYIGKTIATFESLPDEVLDLDFVRGSKNANGLECPAFYFLLRSLRTGWVSGSVTARSSNGPLVRSYCPKFFVHHTNFQFITQIHYRNANRVVYLNGALEICMLLEANTS